MKLLSNRRYRPLQSRTRPVIDCMTLRSGHGKSRYYLCPGCGIPLEREYVNYCDTCGQKLDWSKLPGQTQDV